MVILYFRNGIEGGGPQQPLLVDGCVGHTHYRISTVFGGIPVRVRRGGDIRKIARGRTGKPLNIANKVDRSGDRHQLDRTL